MHTTEAYIFLLLLIRVLGRKAISEMTMFNFTLGITLGSLAAHVSLMGDNSSTATLTALFTFATLGYITDLIHMKSLRVRKLINSQPIVLIDRGQIMKANMAKTKITLTELTKMLRTKSVFNISDVNYAIIENNGELSVLLKAENSPLTPHDMKLKPTEKKLTTDIIMDGELLRENLEYSGITEQELLIHLKDMGIQNLSKVFYAGLESSGKLYVSTGQDIRECIKHGIE
jgi:uncharacterized membrane protein YcaP (DUF421 family)